jgi:hypothetical protein
LIVTDEAHRPDRVEVELFADRHEVVAVGAQAVQHDDAGGRLRAGLAFQGFEGRGCAHGRRAVRIGTRF